MNKEEKGKTLFTSGGVFVDIFVGFLIAACIAGIVYRCFIYNPDVSDQQGEAYMVYFEIEDAQPGYAKYLKSGNTVYDGQSGLQLGELAVHKNSVQGSAVSVQNEDGASEEIKVYGKLRTNPGTLQQGTLVLGGTYMLTPGQVLEIYTDTVCVNVKIVKILTVAQDAALSEQESVEEITTAQPE